MADTYERKLRPIYDAIEARNFKVLASFYCVYLHFAGKATTLTTWKVSPFPSKTYVQTAMKLCTTFLNKYKGDHTARLLQAWAFSGMGKAEETSQVTLQANEGHYFEKRPLPGQTLLLPCSQVWLATCASAINSGVCIFFQIMILHFQHLVFSFLCRL